MNQYILTYILVLVIKKVKKGYIDLRIYLPRKHQRRSKKALGGLRELREALIYLQRKSSIVF